LTTGNSISGEGNPCLLPSPDISFIILFSSLCSMIALVRTDPAKFGASEEKLKLLEKMLQKIEGTVLEGAIFKVRHLF